MSELRAVDPNSRAHLMWLCGAFVALGLVTSLGACNTMEGAGEDISAAGGAMSDSAEDVEDKMD